MNQKFFIYEFKRRTIKVLIEEPNIVPNYGVRMYHLYSEISKFNPLVYLQHTSGLAAINSHNGEYDPIIRCNMKVRLDIIRFYPKQNDLLQWMQEFNYLTH